MKIKNWHLEYPTIVPRKRDAAETVDWLVHVSFLLFSVGAT